MPALPQPPEKESTFTSPEVLEEMIQRLVKQVPDTGHDVKIYLHPIATPLGPLLAGTTGEGVCLLEYADLPRLSRQLTRLASRWNAAFVAGLSALHTRLAAELDAYFAGRLRTFTVPVLERGTPFQRAVWAALRSVPYGRTCSYGALARQLGRAGAVRAVARANGANPIALLIPCHRIIGTDGSLTGYGGGLWRKRWLLRHEGATFTDEAAQLTLAL
ncbi:methylated-DNA--[protein]-cysteine S-methyltransferase [Rhodocaloribacter litoris]|uniref:methylated-DNA--[protein]-cysteine S-methyltransferase n=1 Tax=Rhodocaloribacter litoris TaxID=2558931 RepID=UPI002342CD58|nr:methylated-DNA--[protein]-cysteine S-methyltransferase [Rhodocaloribacter litoris]